MGSSTPSRGRRLFRIICGGRVEGDWLVEIEWSVEISGRARLETTLRMDNGALSRLALLLLVPHLLVGVHVRMHSFLFLWLSIRRGVWSCSPCTIRKRKK
jgi:hypothetical protein